MSSRRSLFDRPPLTGLSMLWPFVEPGTVPGSEPAATLRLASTNALGHNKEPTGYADAVVALDVDVLVVVELADAIRSALVTAGVDERFPHAAVEPRFRWAGAGVWSRRPIEAVQVAECGYAAVAATLAGGPTVIAAHTIAPVRLQSGPRWERSFEDLAALVASIAGPVVVAGDFNATMAHGPLRRFLTTTGLVDAHTAVGRGRARTFPSALPVALLDRVLVSPDIDVCTVAERRLPGSDHLAVLADLALDA